MESMPPTCRTKCVAGCRCLEGEALDDNNECIPISMCPCVYKGLTFNAGYKEVRPGTKHLDLWYVSQNVTFELHSKYTNNYIIL